MRNFLRFQVEIKACAQDSVDMEVNGVAFSQCVVRSITANMYVWPEDEGRGPTKSGTGMLKTDDLKWV